MPQSDALKDMPVVFHHMIKKKLIVVLGMHRSGTSAITRGLQVMGVALGDRLLPPVAGNNEKGFWEDIDLNAFNNEALSALGSDWHHVTPIESGDIEVLRKTGYFLRAVELIRSKISTIPVFGFKDPRVAKLLPFWDEVFAYCEFDVGYLLAVRHPLSVVKSLAKRDGFDAEKGYLLWLGHVLSGLSNSIHAKRIVVDYDRLMQDPDKELKRIADCNGLNIDLQELKTYKVEFLDETLRHTNYEFNDLLLDTACPPLIREVYAEVQKLALEENQFDNIELKKRVVQWAAEFERIKPSLRLVDRLFAQKVTGAQTIVELNLQFASLNQAVADRDNHVETLRQTVNSLIVDRDAQVSGLNQLHLAYDELTATSEMTVAILNQSLVERDDHITSLKQAVVEHDDQITKLSHLVTVREDEVERLNHFVVERNDQIASLNHVVVERDGQIASLNHVVVDRDNQIASLNHVVVERDDQIASLHQVLVEREDHIANMNQDIIKRDLKIVDAATALQAIISSRSWIITKPCRLAGRLFREDWTAVKASIFRTKDRRQVTSSEGLCEEIDKTSSKIGSILSTSTLPDIQSTSGIKQPSRTQKRILLVSYYCPTRAHAGGLRILDIYRLIKIKFPTIELDLYTFRRPDIDWSYKDIESIYDRIYYSTTEELSLTGLLSQCQIRPHYDVIDLQFHQSAKYIDEFRTLGAKILFTPMESLARALFIRVQDTCHLTPEIPIKGIEAQGRDAADELLYCFKADEVICVSKSDATFLRAISPSSTIKPLETGISVIEFQDALKNISLALTPETKENTILYVAYFGSETNVVALKWYIEKVHPLIKAQISNYKLRVVGRGDLSEFRRYCDDSIDLVGEVPSIGSYIDQAKVGIAPALSGSGFRGKVNQYAIYGVPSVVSPIAAMGLAYENTIDIYISEKPEDFADSCASLLLNNELNKEMGNKARQKAFLNYSWESKLDVIKKIYVLDNDV